MKQDYGRNSGAGGSDDNLLLFFVIVVGLYGAGYAAWFLAHEHIAKAYAYIRYVELWLISAVGWLIDIPGFTNVYLWMDRLCEPDALIGLCYRDFKSVQWAEIADSSFIINAILLAVLVIWCFRMFRFVDKHHPGIRFAKVHNIKSYVAECEPLYPHLKMFANLDLIHQPLDHPVFGMSLTSRQFAYHYRLIKGWQEDPNGDRDGRWTPIIDREKTTQVFTAQLGKHWTKSTDLSPAETLLVAIALPRVAATDAQLSTEEFNRAMKDSKDMIDWCWKQFNPPVKTKKSKFKKVSEADTLAWLRPDVDLTYPRGIILRYIGCSSVVEVLERHAFVRTVIFDLFQQARRLGVLPPCTMRWMRFYDRELWYVLQTIGRGSGFAEGDAPLGHFLYESRGKEAIVEPQVDKVVDGLERVIAAFKYSDADKARYEKLCDEDQRLKS